MKFKGGSAYLIGTVSSASDIDSEDVSEQLRFEYFNNVIHFSDWVRQQMETEEQKYVLTTHWATRSFGEWIACQDPFQPYSLRDDLLRFTGPCKDRDTGDNVRFDTDIPLQSSTDCEDHCKDYGKRFPLTACQYEESTKQCKFITRETFYGDGSSTDTVCFIFHKNLSGKEKLLYEDEMLSNI